jgi:spore coat protein CotH
MRQYWVLVLSIGLAACGDTPADAGGIAGPSLASNVAATASQGAVDPMFSQSVLHEVRIVIDPGDWQALRDNFRENQYYAANISIDNEVLQQVGIRSRGDGSRNANKPGLKVDFNKYIPNQEHHGYKTIVLDNIVQDASMIRERLAYAVYEAMGIPAPAIAHCRLTVNDQFWGVYTIIEPISKPFLKARLGEESGNLFDYEYTFNWDFSYRGDDPEAYTPLPFDPETNENKFDPKGLIDFVRIVNETSDAAFLGELSKFMDADKFLTYLATENAIAEHDGFVGEFGMNNFYLYQFGNTTRFLVIPWDKDTAFTATQWPVSYNLTKNVLTRRLTADPAKMKVYKDAVARGAGFVNARFLVPQLEAAYAQIREAALADTKKPFGNDVFESAIGGLRGVITAREADILAQAP